MDDRVGDILAARARLDTGWMPAIFILSLVMHGGIAAFGVWTAMHTKSAMPVSVLNIKFAPMRDLRKTPAPVTPVVRQPAAPVAPPEKPRIEAPKPKAEDVKPSVAKPVANAVPLSPFGKSTKKGAENPVVTPPAGPPPVPQGGSGITGLEGGDFPYPIYIDRMHTLVGQKWLRPQITNATTTIYFVIDRDGTVRDAKVETTSLNSTFDRAALRAVIESSPLPP
ncbi:MAG TPA: TonB C-terminal domain-containing protein, partial [Thermoanaerobaculia bacterium]|nr:TonB C-terminal domain-containing protein [Thermoanaerobaculia bacterium]